MGYIYKITNIINQDFYIGQTKCKLNARFRTHKSNAKSSKYINNKFYNAVLKYGINNFKINVLEECNNEELDNKEIYYIDLLKPKYNTSKGGKSTKGFSGKSLSNVHFKNLRESNFKKVYQYSLNGDFIQSFNSLIDAGVFLGHKKHAKQISHCIRGNQPTACGYIWKTELIKVEKYIKGTTAIKIAQYSIDNKLIKIWDSALQAEKELGFLSCKICLCLSGKRKLHAGYVWKKISK